MLLMLLAKEKVSDFCSPIADIPHPKDPSKPKHCGFGGDLSGATTNLVLIRYSTFE